MALLRSFCLSIMLGMLIGGCGPSNEKQTPPDAGASANDSPVSDQVSPDEESSVLEVIGNVRMIPVELPGFARLEVEEKFRLYERYLEAAGQDLILYQTNGGEHLRIKNLLEQVVTHSGGVPPTIKKKIKPYLSKFWLHRGNVDLNTGKKISPSFIPGELGAATQVALQNGASIDTSDLGKNDLGATRLEELENLLRIVRPVIFTARLSQSKGSKKSPSIHQKMESAPVSAAIARAKADDLRELSAPLQPIGGIVGYEMPSYGAAYEKLKGQFSAIDKRVREVGGRKSTGLSHDSSRVRPMIGVALTGTYGPVWPGKNELHGRGPILSDLGEPGQIFFHNLAVAYEKSVGSRIVSAFSSDEGIAQRRLQCRPGLKFATLVLREMFGNGKDGTEAKPLDWFSNRLGSLAPVVAELRADLAALYLSFDPQVRATGILGSGECADVYLDDYVGTSLELIAQPHFDVDNRGTKARVIVLNHLIHHKLIQVSFDEKRRLVVGILEREKMKDAISSLLAETRRIRFAGDRAGAAKLIEQFGEIPPSWTTELPRHYNSLGISDHQAFVYPILRPKIDATGEIVDIEAVFPSSFYERQIQQVQQMGKSVSANPK